MLGFMMKYDLTLYFNFYSVTYGNAPADPQVGTYERYHQRSLRLGIVFHIKRGKQFAPILRNSLLTCDKYS